MLRFKEFSFLIVLGKMNSIQSYFGSCRNLVSSLCRYKEFLCLWLRSWRECEDISPEFLFHVLKLWLTKQALTTISSAALPRFSWFLAAFSHPLCAAPTMLHGVHLTTSPGCLWWDSLSSAIRYPSDGFSGNDVGISLEHMTKLYPVISLEICLEMRYFSWVRMPFFLYEEQ